MWIDGVIYNLLLEILCLDEYQEPEMVTSTDLEDILQCFIKYGIENGLLEDNITAKDLFDTKIMGALVPRPSEVISTFWQKYEQSPETATDYYYKLSCDSDYIRRYRICKDMKWISSTPYGDMDITINIPAKIHSI